MTRTSVWAPITKSEEQDDGTVFVYGKATDSSLDRDSQRCDAQWLAEAMPEWFKIGNIREQHDSKRAVGKATEHEIAPDGHYIKAHIVDPVAVLKVKHKVLQGFSIGISNPKVEMGKADAPNGLISGGSICEISVCDRPSNAGCTLQLAKSAEPGMEVKAADYDAERGLVRVQELVEKDVEPEAKKAPAAAVFAEPEVRAAEQVPASVKAMDGCDGMCCDRCGMKPDASSAKALEPADMEAAKAWYAAKAFLEEVLVKAPRAASKPGAPEDLGVQVPPVDPPEELADIHGAKAALAIISQLIQSEASEMVCAPNEDLDIACLMQAVGALREFIRREKGETDDAGSGMLLMSDEPDLEKAKYSAEQLRSMLSRGQAMANANGDPSYPIADKEDLENAIHAVGRGSGDHDKIRSYIKRRASALGASDMIPDSWSGDSSKKSDDEGAEMAASAGDIEKTAEEVVEPEVNVNITVDGKPLKVMAQKVVDENLKVIGQGVIDEVTEPVAAKAAVVEPDPDVIVKAFTAALEKADSPLRKSFETVIDARLGPPLAQLGELGAELEKVKAMAVPGGPALRRTDIERTEAVKSDLLREAARCAAYAESAVDVDLRRGYAAKAAQLKAEIKALAT